MREKPLPIAVKVPWCISVRPDNCNTHSSGILLSSFAIIWVNGGEFLSVAAVLLRAVPPQRVPGFGRVSRVLAASCSGQARVNP